VNPAVPYRKRVGSRGESLAADHLVRKGYRIAGRNVRCGHDEIDLVAYDGPVLVFVEVKTDLGGTFGEPETWVGPRKQARLVRAAQKYLHRHRLDDVDCRFDVVVVCGIGENPEIRHWENAFTK
jgi:putative endonuclease